MPAYEDLIILIPSHSLEDFPVEPTDKEAPGLLNVFSVAWHPALMGKDNLVASRDKLMASMLKQHGYATAILGKWHLANMEDCTPAGPFSQWSLQRGFDRYYGFLGGATDQFSPELVVDNHPIDPPSHAGYHLSEDLVNQAIGMITAGLMSLAFMGLSGLVKV